MILYDDSRFLIYSRFMVPHEFVCKEKNSYEKIDQIFRNVVVTSHALPPHTHIMH